MTEFIAHREAVAGALERLMPALMSSPRAKSRCAWLLGSLRTPVRVGILGLRAVEKQRVLNALIGQDLVAPELDVPTLEIVSGPRAQTEAIFAHGETRAAPGYPSSETLEQSPVFLSLSSPACAQQARQYLLLVCEDDPDDLGAGLNWASTRVDLAIWCTRSWTDLEDHAWRNAPEALKRHAFLCWTEGCPTTGHHRDLGFEESLSISDSLGLAHLAGHLSRIIGDAMANDLLVAEQFLQKHGAGQSAEERGQSAEREVEQPKSPGPEAGLQVKELPERSARHPTSDATAGLAHLFRFVRKSAVELHTLLETEKVDRGEVLGAFESVFEEISDYASEDFEIAETWPEIDAMLRESSDLMTLLRLEDGAEPVTDAARLLLQVRLDLEAAIAA